MTEPVDDARAEELQQKARRHLWMHFANLKTAQERDFPVFVKGDGCYLWDSRGRRYLDALSGLFVVQVGHGRADVAAPASAQAQTLAYHPIWGNAHEPAIELAARIADLAPGDLNRVFFTTGGSEAVESAWKLARAYFKAIGQPLRSKAITRFGAYHGVTMGALALTGVPALREPYEPLMGGVAHVANTNRFRPMCPPSIADDDEAFSQYCADAIEQAIVMEGPETVACVFLEPLQNSGGCLAPPPGYFAKVREICDRYGALLVSDEVICAFGRLTTYFGAQRYGYQPDLLTFAKGVTSGYAPLGGVLVSDRVAEPFVGGTALFNHGITFGGHPASCAVALANLDVFAEEDVLGQAAQAAAGTEAALRSLLDLPNVGDVRGDGCFWALELVPDPDDHSVRFTRPEREALVRGFLVPRLLEAGLIARADDRVDALIQVAPPLVAGPEEFAYLESTLRTVLTEAAKVNA